MHVNRLGKVVVSRKIWKWKWRNLCRRPVVTRLRRVEVVATYPKRPNVKSIYRVRTWAKSYRAEVPKAKKAPLQPWDDADSADKSSNVIWWGSRYYRYRRGRRRHNRLQVQM